MRHAINTPCLNTLTLKDLLRLDDNDNFTWSSSFWDQGNTVQILGLQHLAYVDIDEKTPRSTRLYFDSPRDSYF